MEKKKELETYKEGEKIVQCLKYSVQKKNPNGVTKINVESSIH